MGDVEKYHHEHEKSSDWFRDNFIRFSPDLDKDKKEVHHHKIVERSTGTIGEGWGWSYKEAESKAWDSLKEKAKLRAP